MINIVEYVNIILSHFWNYIYILRNCRCRDRMGRSIDNYLCNQCLSPLTLLVQIPLRRGVLDTTLCDEVCQ